MERSRLRRPTLLVCALLLTQVVFLSPVDAGNRLSLHWAREDANAPLTVRVGNNRLGRKWGESLARAAADWSRSSVLDVRVVPGRSDPATCRMTEEQVEVCAQDYGKTAWIGITRYWILGDAEDGHILAASIKVNNYYHRTPAHHPRLVSDEARRATMCHELGHALGLAHQRGRSCLHPNAKRIVDHPNRHDFEEVKQIYRHADNPPPHQVVGVAEGGRALPDPPPPRSEPEDGNVFVQDLGDGTKVVTVIDWI